MEKEIIVASHASSAAPATPAAPTAVRVENDLNECHT